MADGAVRVRPARMGSAAWGDRHHGLMTSTERLRFALQAAFVQLATRGRSLLPASGRRDGAIARLDPARLRVPDTAAVQQATELIEDSAPHWVVRHSLRTWSWAVLFAQLDALKPDEEALAVACLLHDVALDARGIDPHAGCGPCFAIAGSRHARRFLSSLGWSEERAARVDDAIALHMNVRVDVRDGVEAHLLHEGAALDVVGARFREIDARLARPVLERFPRDGFKARMRGAMSVQAAASPTSRVGLLMRLGLDAAIDSAPWPD